MIAMSRDKEEYPQPPWLSRSCSGRSRQDLMERGCVDNDEVAKSPFVVEQPSCSGAPGCHCRAHAAQDTRGELGGELIKEGALLLLLFLSIIGKRE